MDSKHIVAALDVGTTTLRCHCYDEQALLLGSASDTVDLLYPQKNFVEIDPEIIILKIVEVFKQAIKVSGVAAHQVTCLGISCQRSSFVTWSKSTGQPFHPIITWRDLRADRNVKQFNRSPLLKIFRTVSKLVYLVTRTKRSLAASNMRVINQQVTPRLSWAIKNIPALRKAVANGDAAFGTLDSWILYRLSGRAVHVTDFSQASCTGFYDPYILDWNTALLKIFSVPKSILPKVLDTATTFCVTDPAILGASIPVMCSAADQSASMFGSCCFSKGDIKFTLGTGTFVNVHTGHQPPGLRAGFYPLVAWRVNGETAFMAEAASNDTGTVIKWAQKIGLFDDPAESGAIAASVQDSGGVYFVPAFSGLQAPIHDDLAATGFIGLNPNTSREHMVRAMLESIAFRVDQLFELAKSERNTNFSKISLDGGVSKNDFVVQLLADLTQTEMERAASSEMSALGAAFLAGLAAGIWESKERLPALLSPAKTVFPGSRTALDLDVLQWRASLARFQGWHVNS